MMGWEYPASSPRLSVPINARPHARYVVTAARDPARTCSGPRCTLMILSRARSSNYCNGVSPGVLCRPRAARAAVRDQRAAGRKGLPRETRLDRGKRSDMARRVQGVHRGGVDKS